MAEQNTEDTYESGFPEDEKDQQKLLEKLDRMFRASLDHPSWITGRKDMLQCFQYREGDQWTTAELKTLEERGQPATVNNQVAVTINKLVGDLTEQKYRIGYRGRNDQFDKEVSDVLSDIFLYIRQLNDLEFEERDMADDGFTSGFGCMEVFVTFDDMYQPEIRVRWEDPLVVFPDPNWRRYDWNEDAKYVIRAKWFPVDEAEELYPRGKGHLETTYDQGSAQSSSAQLSGIDKFKNDNYFDYKNKKVRIVEVEYKHRTRKEVILFSDGKSAPKEAVTQEHYDAATAAGLTFKTLERVESKICRGVYAGYTLLDHFETDQKFFSLVPYVVYRRKNGVPYSLITLALSMQDAINKRESKALHLLNTNQVLFETGAVKQKDKLAEEIARPDGQIELADGALSQQKFQIQRNIELAASQFTMHQRAQEDYYRITGVDPRIADTGELRSGVAVQRKAQIAQKPVAPIFENLRRTRKILARVLMDRVGKYFTAQKVMLITDDLNKSKLVGISAPILEKIKTAQYDAVVDDFIDNTTLQQEQYALLLQYLPQILPFGPYWVKKLIQLSDLRNKDELIKEMEAQEGPPPIDPKVSLQATIDKLSPIEKAFFYERMGGQSVAEQILKDNPPSTDELQASVELAKTSIQEQHQTNREAMGHVVALKTPKEPAKPAAKK